MSIARSVYAYMEPESGGKAPPNFMVLDIDEDAQVTLTVRSSGEIVRMPLPYEQLAQMLYRLRDERRMHVMSIVAAEQEKKKSA